MGLKLYLRVTPQHLYGLGVKCTYPQLTLDFVVISNVGIKRFDCIRLVGSQVVYPANSCLSSSFITHWLLHKFLDTQYCLNKFLQTQSLLNKCFEMQS